MAARENGIVKLCVGGTNFATTKETLNSTSSSFFTALLSGRVPSLKDENGAYFIDRDPTYFQIILNFLRTRELNYMKDVDLVALRSEANFYSLEDLLNQLNLLESHTKSACGGLLFHGVVRRGSLNQEHRIKHLTAHGDWLALATSTCVSCYRFTDTWRASHTTLVETSPIDGIALHSKFVGIQGASLVVGLVTRNEVKLYRIPCEEGGDPLVASYEFSCIISEIIFVSNSLVCLGSAAGVFGVWHGTTKQWIVQRVSAPITSWDATHTGLCLLGLEDGTIKFCDMNKFPVRMDNPQQLLLSELYRDDAGEPISALSAYIPQARLALNNESWLELAYGTPSGRILICVQHPEHFSQSPIMFQSFAVHCSTITRVRLSDRHLISVCADRNHVRVWPLPRFRSMLSSLPGSGMMPSASYNLVTTDHKQRVDSSRVELLGPFGHQDDKQLFIHQMYPFQSSVSVISAADGSQLGHIDSVDGSGIMRWATVDWTTTANPHSNRFLFTAHENGAVQAWNLHPCLADAPELKSEKKKKRADMDIRHSTVF